METIAIYAGLFLSAFFSATLLPLQSETVLVALLLTDRSPWPVIVIASVGNVAGAVVNWLIGRGIEQLRDRRWFPLSAASLQRSQAWYLRYGKWSLLLSWMPVIGDPITVVAGVLREPLPMFLVLVSIAKIGRYLVLAGLTLGWT
ncbi:DedA family protein [Steroidobacter sp. S1-65]|uniref:DedA family protein n=1 Tax=Steroidobacter gossypii TaxID=2805490 RepID=A0ABS1X0H5_9GAMM|nr:YqaA family protein [Steroidobacter gossypii]MBM0106735.1 DedA family protein [Steroidobacter gossypii]